MKLLSEIEWENLSGEMEPWLRIAKERESLGLPGRIAPFGEHFENLVIAVAVKGKPVAEYSIVIYEEEKELCDSLLNQYGLEKINDRVSGSIWFFKPQDREDAVRRVLKFHSIEQDARNRGYLTWGDHRALGKLFGYSDEDIHAFLTWEAITIMRSYAMTGTVESSYLPLRMALTVDLDPGRPEA